jgi:hypothetical protein
MSELLMKTYRFITIVAHLFSHWTVPYLTLEEKNGSITL